MNTNKLQMILDAYNPEDDLGKITYTDAALLEVVIDMAEQIDELRQQIARLEADSGPSIASTIAASADAARYQA
ncbi:MAG: hypothetical protein KAX65_01620 [Caldilineaceae bacterium]|nr:hypothetical protein [Caldilineaceae bacterium]